MVGAQRDRLAQIERIKFDCVVGALFVIGFIGRQDHRLVGLAQRLGHLGVGGGHALDRIDQEDDHIGLVDRQLGLRAHMAGDLGQRGVFVFFLEQQPGRIHHCEDPAIPIGITVQPITRGAGNIGDDRLALADQAIEKR